MATTKRTTATRTAAKRPAAAPAPQPLGTASVGPVGEPSGVYWDQLAAAKTPAQLRALDDHLAAHGYAAGGQLRAAVAAKLGEG